MIRLILSGSQHNQTATGDRETQVAGANLLMEKSLTEEPFLSSIDHDRDCDASHETSSRDPRNPLLQRGEYQNPVFRYERPISGQIRGVILANLRTKKVLIPNHFSMLSL